MKHRYLLWFANDKFDWRFSEIESIVCLFKSTIKWIESSPTKPYWIAELPSEQLAFQIASRSVTLKHISQIWSHAENSDDLHRDLKTYTATKLQEDYLSTYKINVIAYGNSQNDSEKLSKINALTYLPFKGRVKLNDPDITLHYVEYYGQNPNSIPEAPHEIIFGKLVSIAQRKVITNLSLKTRKFIGNTSMESKLSLIMANLAKVRKGDLILDPFVGSGSLLVAAAHFGAYVMGVDIDFLMLHGRSKPTRVSKKPVPRSGESVLANLTQYGLSDYYIDVIVGDSSVPMWTENLILDAIITDPPYGIREAMERIGSNKSEKEKLENKMNFSYPKKIVYKFHQMMYDLLCFSALHLKQGGRLVTWIPVFRDDYNEEDYISQHTCFKVVSNCEQILSKVISRRLITYEKIRHPEADELYSCRIVNNEFRDRYLSYRFSRRKGENNDCAEMENSNL